MSEPCSFPAAQVRRWIELVHRFNVSASELLAGSGLSEGIFPSARACVRKHRALDHPVARSLTGEPAIGILAGCKRTHCTLAASASRRRPRPR